MSGVSASEVSAVPATSAVDTPRERCAIRWRRPRHRQGQEFTMQVTVSHRPRICDVADYYDDPAVRKRLLEYCGGSEHEAPSAVYVATLRDDERPHLTWDRSARVPVRPDGHRSSANAAICRGRSGTRAPCCSSSTSTTRTSTSTRAVHPSGGRLLQARTGVSRRRASARRYQTAGPRHHDGPGLSLHRAGTVGPSGCGPACRTSPETPAWYDDL